ncbi:thioesterase family protein [Novosphingobium aquimarinum]|uniref:thioesterase family protein n=1 Tax=Novosphingobium aquimarinum TaxID=2682494 RepID=UPI0012EB97F8|nr:thioesterase family protein [Novosphingobium aquimarinum]
MPGFAQVLAEAEETASGRAFTVPDAWSQGRTAYGGFSTALALDEAMRSGSDLPPLRSAQIAMIAPLAGRIEASAQVLRRGRNAIWIEARLTSEKGVGLVANFVFMQAVESRLVLDAIGVPEGLILPDDAVPFFSERSPSFLRENFEARHALPDEGHVSAQECWWVRLVEREGLHPMTAMLLCGDALPPSVISMLGPTVPVSSMHWQVNVLDTEPQPHDGWWLLRSTGDFVRDGGLSESISMWGQDMRPVSTGTQSIALFG